MKLKSFFKGELVRSASIIFLAGLSSNLILFVANLVIAKVLGPDQFGIFKTIVYLAGFLPLLIELGINATLTKYIAEFGKKKEKIGYLVKNFIKLKVLTYVLLIVLTLVFKDELSLYLLKDASMSYLLLPAILLMALSFFSIFQFIVLGYQKFKLFALTQFLSFSSAAILGILLSGFGIFYIVLGWSFGTLIGNLFNIKFFFEKEVIKKSKEFDIKKIFVRFSIPIYLTNIIMNSFNVIIPILSIFFSQKIIGYFSFAFIFYFATMLIPTSISSVVFPKVSELNGLKRHKDAKNILRKAFSLYALVMIVGLLLVMFLTDWFISIIAKEYLPSSFMFKVLVSFGLVFGFNTIYVNYLQGLGKVKRFALFNLIQNVLLFIISFALLNVAS